MKFFNLHHHTTYSFLDGYGTPQQIVDRLQAVQQEGYAITDHGNIYGHIPMLRTFKKADKHLVFGCEFYTVPELRKDRTRFHTTVLIKNDIGYRHLLELMNIANKQFYYKPRITFEQLRDKADGLIILTGCFCDGWLFKNPAGWDQWCQWFKGTEWYMELQPFEDLKEKWQMLSHIALTHDIPAIITMDSHYPSPENKAIHDFMLAINIRRPLSDPDRLKMDYPLHMPSISEIIERCQKMGIYKEEWITESYNLAMQCQVKIPGTSMIKLNIPASKIAQKCRQNMPSWMKEDIRYITRLNHELKLIEEKGFIDYFYIIMDLMQYAKQHMLCGPGRGSSAGSLVCYLLGITAVDPIKFDLLFERFIDINRTDLPDIDLDFPASQRERIIQYLKKRYHPSRVAQLISFSTYKPRAIIQDAGRVLGIPQWELKNALSQIISRDIKDSRAELCLMDSVERYENLKRLFQKYSQLHITPQLEGQIRQTGKHAAAVAIANDDLKKITVLKDDTISVDKYTAGDIGILKIDVLGLVTLDIIQDISKECGMNYREFYNLPLNDPLTFERVFTPASVNGIFQFEGTSVRRICELVKPTQFEQLVHIISLARPGPINSHSTSEYIKRLKEQSYTIDPLLAPYTKDTMGIIIFQEQVMQIVKEIGGFSGGDTSTIRKAMSKNLGQDFFNQFKAKFIAGAQSKNISSQHAEQIWLQIYTHGSWSFNKSHAVSYALLSYWMGYLKTHWPGYFYARVLRDKTSKEEIIPLLREYEGKFIAIDLNESSKFPCVKNGILYGGFTNLKGIGESMADKIITMQPFQSIDDFRTRVPGSIAGKVLMAIQKGIEWSDFRSLQEQVDLSPVNLSSSIDSWEKVNALTSITIGKVIRVNLKDMNEPGKLKKRGYSMDGWTEYIVLKVIDNNFNIWHVCFDRKFTQKNKQILLSTKDRICLFKISKPEDLDILHGKAVKILEEKTQ